MVAGAAQAILSGGRQTGTLEQQAGGTAANSVEPHAPIDRLEALAVKTVESWERQSPSPASSGLVPRTRGSSPRSGPQASGAVDIGGSGYGPATRGSGPTRPAQPPRARPAPPTT